MTRNRRNSDGPYAESAKQALVLGAPTLDSMLNQFYLSAQKESYDSIGNPKLYAGMAPEHHDLNTVFCLETMDTGISPSVRMVQVYKKEGYLSFLVEPQDRARGICIVMFSDEKSHVRCNLRFLPFSTIADIAQTQKDPTDLLSVVIPKSDVIKLNITLTASNVGEVLYSTHKTEVNVEATTEDEVVALERTLEFNAAGIIAHYCGEMIKVEPSEPFTKRQLTGLYRVNMVAGDPSWFSRNWRKLVLSIACLGSITAVASTAGSALGVLVVAEFASWGQFLVAVSGPTSGLLRNIVGLAGPYQPSTKYGQLQPPVRQGQQYQAWINDQEYRIQITDTKFVGDYE
ncbi:hypothetical protein SG34_033565 [Thalassomonas viridans]|uniref:Uncharacterized protein n=1 Tax=Thalassomonas viridans TaxID=137584 RepID=A0AAE9Z964_9GAMM|nr:hypothetical protein [Thalassomonas viridans]WDE08823.1 hypothetical protein SG34_033565 [Thalassomonas viridans]